MNRREVAGAMIATALGSHTLTVNADTGSKPAVLSQLIDEVIADGNIENLEQIVTHDVTIAALGVTNISEFNEASVEGFNSRSEQYESVDFAIESIAENEDWCHALVRFEGKNVNGKMEARFLFYAARFHEGLIQKLYLA